MKKTTLLKYYKKHMPWIIKARERDGQKCVRCGSTENLVVHHKDGSRKLGLDKMDNSLENLLTVCKPCHAKEHGQVLRFSNPNIKIILELRSQGKTFQKIATYLGLSRQRVHQIIKRADL